MTASQTAAEVHDLLAHDIAAGRQPEDWKEVHLAWLLKHGKPANSRSSYRGISLIETMAKISTRISETIISKYLRPPAAFACSIAGRSTHDLIFVANEVLRRTSEQGREATILLVDATSAFDTIDQQGIINALMRSSAPPWGIRLQILRLRGVKTTTKIGSAASTVFRTRGVPQGSPSGSTL